MSRLRTLRRCGVLAAAGALLGLGLLSIASAGVNAPQSGWYSGNPLLGPNAIDDLACAGDTCYASGAFGTLLKSTDAGATWKGVVTGIRPDLPRVRLAGGSADRIVTGGACAVRRSDDGGNTFMRLPFAASDQSCPAGVSALAFPAAQIGYLALGNGSILSTADSGRTFSRRTALPGGPATDLLCTSNTTCLATSGTSIQRTTDGASSWTQVASGTAALNGLEQADPLTFYAVGSALTVLKSTDGGLTWSPKPVTGTPAGDLATIRCATALTCLLSTKQGNQILRTTDGGDTYSSVVPSTDGTFGVAFASPTRALAAGALGSVEVSNDAGATWAPVGGRVAGFFGVLAAASSSVAYAGGDNGVLARTTDAGQSWQNVSAPTSASIVSIAAPSANRVFVLDGEGTLQRSDNGGGSYKLLNADSAGSIVALDDDHLLVVGRGVRRSEDGGETFADVQDPDVRGRSFQGADVAGRAVFVYSERRLALSTDSGQTWKLVRLPKGLRIASASFVSAKTGGILAVEGRPWRTTNGGKTWSRLDALGPEGASTLDFADALHGLAVVNRFGTLGAGIVLRTADGGGSWHPQLVSREAVQELESAGGADYALAGASSLYATTTGGDIGAAQELTLSTAHRVLKKHGTIAVSGLLKPADGGEEVVVSMRGSRGWASRIAIVASNGRFTTNWRVTADAIFVAQVLGDADHAGAGTKPLRVRLAKKR